MISSEQIEICAYIRISLAGMCLALVCINGFYNQMNEFNEWIDFEL